MAEFRFRRWELVVVDSFLRTLRLMFLLCGETHDIVSFCMYFFSLIFHVYIWLNLTFAFIHGVFTGKSLYYSFALLWCDEKNSFNMTHIFIILFRSVPGPPASAYLKTLSSDSIQIDFSAPLNDGGTPINSYTVRLLENLWSFWFVCLCVCEYSFVSFIRLIHIFYACMHHLWSIHSNQY